MIMKIYIPAIYFLTVALFLASCQKSITDYRDEFLKGEEKYIQVNLLM